ncbi:MAG: hypothetical protein WCF38_04770 [Pseudolabrys sp.]|jgi:hypothetical protein
MPTNRRPRIRQSRPSAISPKAIELYRRTIAIENSDLADISETDGGKQREYLNLSIELRRELGLRPWMRSPLQAADADDYARAHRQFQELEAALEVSTS